MRVVFYLLPAFSPLREGGGSAPCGWGKEAGGIVFCRDKLLDYWNTFYRHSIVLSSYDLKAINVTIIPP
jgi:hypothetical protein